MQYLWMKLPKLKFGGPGFTVILFGYMKNGKKQFKFECKSAKWNDFAENSETRLNQPFSGLFLTTIEAKFEEVTERKHVA